MQFLIDIVFILIYLCGFLLITAWTWRFWVLYIQQKHLSSIEWAMFEIKLPREIMKSPLAMETALSSLLQGGGIGPAWYKQFFKGVLAIYSSLEVASLEGVIHFYIRVQKKFRPLVESNLYAQYPGIEIIEADDYTKRIRYYHLSDNTKIWGVNFFLSEKWAPTDPDTGKAYQKKKGEDYKIRADFLPIKTYLDYGLDKDPKEELKIDPLTPLLELMGSIGKGEYMWYQVLVEDDTIYNASYTAEPDKKMPKLFVNEITNTRYSLIDMAKERKKQIRTGGYLIKGSPFKDKYGDLEMKKSGKKDAEGKDIMIPALYPETKAESKDEIKLTVEEKDEIEAINKKILKPLSLVVIRLLYIAKKENYNSAHIQSVLSAYKSFNGCNKFGLSPTDPYDYPWQTMGNKRVAWRGEEKFEAYVGREGFFPSSDSKATSKFWDIDLWEDTFFWSSSMKARKLFHTIYQVIFRPFHTPTNNEISILNMEELATIWHFPGAVATTPTLPRIESMKGVAPVNLPQ